MLTKEVKEEIIKEFQRTGADSGSSEVQVALLTERIKQITQHLKLFPKDKHSTRGLIKLVARRRKFYSFLKKTNPERHEFVVKKIESSKNKK